MTTEIKNCILCGKEGTDRTLNQLPMRTCIVCNVTWRKNFDVHIEHYEEKEVDFSASKTESRLRNSYDRIKLFRKYINLDDLCDIGCGEGIFLQALMEAGYQNAFGLEPSDNVSHYAQEHGLQIYKGTIENIRESLKDKPVYVITMFHLIEHLHDPISALKGIHNVLPEEGYLIIETPDIECYSFRTSSYKHKLIYKEHLFYFSSKSLRLLLEKAGFKVVAMGRRDFDLEHLSTSELLKRIGWRKVQKEVFSTKTFVQEDKSTHSSTLEKKNYIVKVAIKKILASIVVLLGRADYLWAIAKK